VNLFPELEIIEPVWKGCSLSKLHTAGAQGSDNFYTPAYAVAPIIKLLSEGIKPNRIWEPFVGAGGIAQVLFDTGVYSVTGTDIDGNEFGCPSWTGDFFRAPEHFIEDIDCIISNPPYSMSDEILERLFRIGKPFALLMPVSRLHGVKRQSLYRKYGTPGFIAFDNRVNFKEKSWKDGKEGAGAWQYTGWFCWNMGINGQWRLWEIGDSNR